MLGCLIPLALQGERAAQALMSVCGAWLNEDDLTEVFDRFFQLAAPRQRNAQVIPGLSITRITTYRLTKVLDGFLELATLG
jgi:hypothetical protein